MQVAGSLGTRSIESSNLSTSIESSVEGWNDFFHG
jgi:hypothetical protein